MDGKEKSSCHLIVLSIPGPQCPACPAEALAKAVAQRRALVRRPLIRNLRQSLADASVISGRLR